MSTKPSYCLAKAGVLLVAIAGPARSGKSLLARGFEEHGFKLYSFAAPLKNMLAQLPYMEHIFNMTSAEKETGLNLYGGQSPRKMMQTLGTEWARNMIHPDIWVHLMAEKILRKVDMKVANRFVIDDLRFENEAKWVRDSGGLIVHISREGSGTAATHSSEAGVQKVAAEDWNINNNGGTEAQLMDRASLLVRGIQDRIACINTGLTLNPDPTG
jgi:hypothetical protein